MLSKPSILIVDDKPENLLALAMTLEPLDADVVSVESGAAALWTALRRNFALAILDAQMPQMDGYELAELLRGDHSMRAMPIIFLIRRRS